MNQVPPVGFKKDGEPATQFDPKARTNSFSLRPSLYRAKPTSDNIHCTPNILVHLRARGGEAGQGDQVAQASWGARRARQVQAIVRGRKIQVRPPPTPIPFRQCRLILPSLGNKSNGPEKTSPDPGRPKTLERAPAARTAKPANRQMDGNCTFTGENLRPGEGLHCALLPPRRKPMQATCEACPNREPGLDHTGQSHLRVPEKSTSHTTAKT
jgi:hypothetical protein